jgi:hypothetical protein
MALKKFYNNLAKQALLIKRKNSFIKIRIKLFYKKAQ